mgnify:CR=1 FL=1
MGAPVSHIVGYGIPAIPTQPATAMFSHRFHRIHRSLLLRRNSHRFVGGYGIPAIPTQPATAMFSHRIHRIHRSLLLRRNSHRFHGFTQMVRLRSGLPQNTQNSQKFITEKKLPQISRIYTDVSKMFCVFREFCGSKYLCKSVKSVGEYSLPVCSVNSVNSVGEYSLPICSVNSVNSVGVLFWLRGYGRDAIPSYNSVGTTP